MVKSGLLLTVMVITFFACPLFGQTELKKRFLLQQYEYGIDMELPLFRKYQLWNVTPNGSPMEGKNWTLKIVKNAVDMTNQKPIDFGQKQDRYVRFDVQYNNGRYPVSLSSFVDSNPKMNFIIQMNLYESNGKLVKTLSKYGRFVGLSESNFVYEAEGKQSILVTYETVAPGKSHSYEIYEVKYRDMLPLSYYESDIVLASEYKNCSENTIKILERGYSEWVARRKSAYQPMPAPATPDIEKWQAELKAACPLFRLRFTREYCASAYYDLEKDICKINGFVPMGDCYSTYLDWGNKGDRFLRFEPVWVPYRIGTNAALKDDIYGSKQAVVLALNLYESDGTFVKRVAFGGGCMMWGEGNLFFRGENGDGWLFRAEKIKLNSGYTPSPIHTYKIITQKYAADNLSQITKYPAWESFSKFVY